MLHSGIPKASIFTVTETSVVWHFHEHPEGYKLMVETRPDHVQLSKLLHIQCPKQDSLDTTSLLYHLSPRKERPLPSGRLQPKEVLLIFAFEDVTMRKTNGLKELEDGC